MPIDMSFVDVDEPRHMLNYIKNNGTIRRVWNRINIICRLEFGSQKKREWVCSYVFCFVNEKISFFENAKIFLVVFCFVSLFISDIF